VKTAEGQAVVTVPVMTNASGNGALYIFSDKIGARGNNYNDSFATTLNAASFNPATGI